MTASTLQPLAIKIIKLSDEPTLRKIEGEQVRAGLKSATDVTRALINDGLRFRELSRAENKNATSSG